MEVNIGVIIHIVVMFASGLIALFTIFEDNEIINNISSIICILSMLLFIASGCMMEKQPWNLPEDPFSTEYIVAMNDSNQTNGRFYARRGYIEENLYYQYMTKVGSGYKAGKVKADSTILYYTDDDFRVERYKKTRNWLWFEQEAYYYKIYIPEGSITDEYSVDLQ